MDARSTRLSHAELAVVDALITLAQERNIGIDTTDDDDDANPPAATADIVAARHDGLFRLVTEEVLPHIQEMTAELGEAPTLRKLIELRGQAVRGG